MMKSADLRNIARLEGVEVHPSFGVASGKGEPDSDLGDAGGVGEPVEGRDEEAGQVLDPVEDDDVAVAAGHPDGDELVLRHLGGRGRGRMVGRDEGGQADPEARGRGRGRGRGRSRGLEDAHAGRPDPDELQEREEEPPEEEPPEGHAP